MSDTRHRIETAAPWLQAAALAVLVVVLHHRLFVEGGILGAPQSDVIRGIWGLDLQARALPLPFWTDRVGFPEGVKILVLPFASSLVAAPLVYLLGAVVAYDLWMLLLLWGAGVASAWLAREVTGRRSAGWLVGAMVIAQPMLFLAITDGTPENVAFWGVPALLAALWRTLRDGDRRFAVAAGLLGFVVAADSPYHAVFVVGLAPLLLLALPGGGASWRDRAVAMGIAGGVAAVGAAAVAALYYGLPFDEAPPSSMVGNAIQMRAWLQWEAGAIGQPWDWTLTPSFVPTAVLLGALGLSLVRPVRASPWLVAALACLLLGLGPGDENPRLISGVLGGWVRTPLSAVADLLAAHPPPVLRFLRRLLVPFTLCLGMAAEVGLSRWRLLPWLGLPAGIAAAAVVAAQTGYVGSLPLTHPPRTAAIAFVADHEQDGAAVFLPQVRAAERLHQRDELPVFAELGQEIQSAAELWLQVDSHRAAVNAPNGLLTMVERSRRDDELRMVLRDFDDLTLPQTVGRPIPPSATSDPERRTRVIAGLVDAGLRFVVLDEALYGEEGLAMMRAYLSGVLVEEQRFDDGTGIVVMVVAPAP